MLCLLTWVDAATTIPGYLEKNTLTEDEFKTKTPSVMIKGQTIILKYCNTCNTVRDVRSMHCSICGYCIKKHDHHCGFVANCVGEKNISKFVYFLSSIVIHSLVIFITSVIVTSNLSDKNYDMSNSNYIICLVISAYSGIFLLGMGGFLVFHLYLISKNRTTNEYIRNLYREDLFKESCSDNFKEAFCIKN